MQAKTDICSQKNLERYTPRAYAGDKLSYSLIWSRIHRSIRAWYYCFSAIPWYIWQQKMFRKSTEPIFYWMRLNMFLSTLSFFKGHCGKKLPRESQPRKRTHRQALWLWLGEGHLQKWLLPQTQWTKIASSVDVARGHFRGTLHKQIRHMVSSIHGNIPKSEGPTLFQRGIESRDSTAKSSSL